jgi:hypothetical protein
MQRRLLASSLHDGLGNVWRRRRQALHVDARNPRSPRTLCMSSNLLLGFRQRVAQGSAEPLHRFSRNTNPVLTTHNRSHNSGLTSIRSMFQDWHGSRKKMAGVGSPPAYSFRFASDNPQQEQVGRHFQLADSANAARNIWFSDCRIDSHKPGVLTEIKAACRDSPISLKQKAPA